MPEECRPRSWTSDLRRWIFAGAGLVCVGLGALGAMLPGLPTTIFLIFASYFFTRSCPWLERRLLRTRLFAPYMAWIDGRRPMPPRAKIIAIASVWIAVSVSFGILYVGGRLGPWLVVIVASAAIVGTFAIATDLAMRMLRPPDGTADA